MKMAGLREHAYYLQSLGEDEDGILAHINPEEAAYLEEYFGSDINPYTGLPQFGFFDRLRKKASRFSRGVREFPGQIKRGAEDFRSRLPGIQSPFRSPFVWPEHNPQGPVGMPMAPPAPPMAPPPPPPMPSIPLRGFSPPPAPPMAPPPPPPMPPMGGGMTPPPPPLPSRGNMGRPAGPSNPLEELQQRFASGQPILQPGRERPPEVPVQSGGFGDLMSELRNRMQGGSPMLQPGRERPSEVPPPPPLTGFPAVMQEMKERARQREQMLARGGFVGGFPYY
jgi:hypothetical protein